MINYITTKTHEDFSHARGTALLTKLATLVDPEREKLLNFSDVKKILKPKGEVYCGMKVVPIDRIVGSEGRYNDFNRFFQPKRDHLRGRWEHVDAAAISNIILPPIQLYEIGGVYFVRDGNHRVSVARMQGVSAIDAEVTSLASEIKVKPKMTKNELCKAVIDYEKRDFYMRTLFGDITNDYKLDFSVTGRYSEIETHISVHKYYLDEKGSGESDWPRAVQAFYDTVYKPIITVIKDENILRNFPRRTPSDLYLYIVRRWDYLKKEG